jgi:hypothetical protein
MFQDHDSIRGGGSLTFACSGSAEQRCRALLAWSPRTAVARRLDVEKIEFKKMVVI